MSGRAETRTAPHRRRRGAGRRLLAAVVVAAAGLAPLARAADRPARAAKAPKKKPPPFYLRAEWRDFDYRRKIALAVGDVRFIPPHSRQLVLADAAVVWFDTKEAYLEGNIRIYQVLGDPVRPGEFDVPRPRLSDRHGLEWNEVLEKAGDLDDIIEANVKKGLLIDTRVPVSQAERLYVNWADGTAYLVKPTLRFTEADRVATWTVTAPSMERIATYKIPVRDASGKFTGRYERRAHYVARNATFTACTFKRPHTSVRAGRAEFIEGDYSEMRHLLFRFGEVPVFYWPYLFIDHEHEWPSLRAEFGSSSRRGAYGSAELRIQLAKGLYLLPRIEYMSERGAGLGLGAKYHYDLGDEGDIRGALDAFWLPGDDGTDELADTSRTGSGWPAGWTPAIAAALGPLPGDLPLGEDNRYRIHFWHQQEYPRGMELDVEVQKFSDAGVYREFFEKEFKTEKPPETRALLKYGRDNWAVFVHVKTRINDFLTQTEYLPQIGFNVVSLPLGGGFLFTSDTEVARVRTRFADTRRRMGQSLLDITREWLDVNEYSRPADLTLREQDTDDLAYWRFDTVNKVSYPFDVWVLDIEPYVGFRYSWFQRTLSSVRGSYTGVLPPEGPALPAAVAAAPARQGSKSRLQWLAGARVSTQFHRVYDVSDRPVLRRWFQYGMRHIITPEVTWTYESSPTIPPDRLPESDAVTEEKGLHKINFALRNRWQTKRAPRVPRDPRAPVGGEWYRRKLAALSARTGQPVDVIDLDMDIDFFFHPSRDNVYPRDKRVRRWSNLRTDLTVRPSRNVSLFFDTELNVSGGPILEVVSAGFAHAPRPDFRYSLSYSYYIHNEAVLGLGLDWDINPKWRVRVNWQQDFSGGGGWDREVVLVRRFHEWRLSFSYEFDKGKNETIGSFRISPTRTRTYRPGWRFQPRSVRPFQIVETVR